MKLHNEDIPLGLRGSSRGGASPAALDEESDPAIEPRKSKGRVLLVSSRPAMLEALKPRLEEYEFEVLTATGPKAAIKAAAAEVPDAVVLDVLPYELGSYYLCMAVRDDPLLEGVPVLVLRSPADRRDAAYAKRVGAAACLDKPVPFAQLIARIRTCVFQRRRDKQVDLVTDPVVYVSSDGKRQKLMQRAINARNFLRRTHYRLVPVTRLTELRAKLKRVRPSAIVLDEAVRDVDTSLICYSLKTDPDYFDLPLVVMLERPDDAPRFRTADARTGTHAHKHAVAAIGKLRAAPPVPSPF